MLQKYEIPDQSIITFTILWLEEFDVKRGLSTLELYLKLGELSLQGQVLTFFEVEALSN